MELAARLKRIFGALDGAGYAWEPQTPDRLVEMRKGHHAPSLTAALGLGIYPEGGEDWSEGALIAEDVEWLKRERAAVARLDGIWIIHDHWPPKPQTASQYVHLGPESRQLLSLLRERAGELQGASLLDLGSGSGVLSMGLLDVISRALGLELSARAALWSKAAAEAQGLDRARFACARIGVPQADAAVSAAGGEWDAAIFNPPMMIPHRGQDFPHRDGGRLGIEIPKIFLEASRRWLRPGGQAMGLITNPIVAGKGLFFEEFKPTGWDWAERERIHPRFNQTSARKEGIRDELGVERVELWFIRLQKR
ncbi:MAG TPA: methyltransferase [Bdellovibrionota bacterium]|nr:methyltransferase [Bdellovibrionota bacterium]